jgi:hypothetical protein
MKTEGAEFFNTTTGSGRAGPVGFNELRSLAGAGTVTQLDNIRAAVVSACDT